MAAPHYRGPIHFGCAPDSAGNRVPLGEAGGADRRLLFATRFSLSAPVGLAALVALLAAAALAVDLGVDCSAASGALIMGSGSQGYKDGEGRHARRCIRPTSSSPLPHPSDAMEQRQYLIRPLEVDGDGAEVERDYTTIPSVGHWYSLSPPPP